MSELKDEVAETNEAMETQPTIHDQVFWDQDLDHLADRWMPFKGMPLQERTAQQQAEWDAFLWETVLHLRDLVQQHALERPVESPKPRKRTRVPKAALPYLNDNGPDAA